MALNDGRHPLMDWKVGPDTGDIANGDFTTFDEFFAAYRTQLAFLIDQSVEYNNMLGHAHQVMRPTPLLSALIEGTIEIGQGRHRGRGHATTPPARPASASPT